MQRMHAKPLRRHVRGWDTVARVRACRCSAPAPHDTPVTADGNVSWTRKRLEKESRRSQDRTVRTARPARRAGGRWPRRRSRRQARRVELRQRTAARIGDRRVRRRARRAEHVKVRQPDIDAARAPGIAGHAERDGLRRLAGRCIRSAAGVLSAAARRHPTARRTAGAGVADADHRRRRHRPEDGVHQQDEQGGQMGEGMPHDLSTPDRRAPGKSRPTGSSDRSARAPSAPAPRATVR